MQVANIKEIRLIHMINLPPHRFLILFTMFFIKTHAINVYLHLFRAQCAYFDRVENFYANNVAICITLTFDI